MFNGGFLLKPDISVRKSLIFQGFWRFYVCKVMFISNWHFGVGSRAQVMLLESVFFCETRYDWIFGPGIFLKAAENPKPRLRRLEQGFYRKSIDSMKFRVMIFQRLSKKSPVQKFSHIGFHKKNQTSITLFEHGFQPQSACWR